MVEFLVTCSLVVYLVALLYGAYRIFVTRGSGRTKVSEHCRRFRMISGRARVPVGGYDLSYYV
jgi:hypothetical protein